MRIEGNERLSKEELLSACREMGLYPGVRKRSVDTQAVTNGLLEDFADISWVSVGIHGTDATIRLAETIEGVEIIDKETPCDIVASTDGVILQITAERGTPLVAAGDVVKKGDVLISSALTIGLEGEEQHTEYTAAEGTVTARIWRRLTEELPLQYEEAVYSGEVRKTTAFSFREGNWISFTPTVMCSGKESCFPRKPSVWGIGSCPSHGGGSVGEHTKRCRKRAPRRKQKHFWKKN